MTYLERATELYNMLEADQAMEAFERFYHDDVVVEPTGETRRGKAAQRTAIQDWVAG